MELVTGERDTGVPHCPDSDCDSVSISVHGLCPRKVISRENHIISARIGRALHLFQPVSHPNVPWSPQGGNLHANVEKKHHRCLTVQNVSPS